LVNLPIARGFPTIEKDSKMLGYF
jgi:hypothetical protein